MLQNVISLNNLIFINIKWHNSLNVKLSNSQLNKGVSETPQKELVKQFKMKLKNKTEDFLVSYQVHWVQVYQVIFQQVKE